VKKWGFVAVLRLDIILRRIFYIPHPLFPPLLARLSGEGE